MTVQPIPEGFHALTPIVAVKEVMRLIDFLKAAFGAVELLKIHAPDGSVMHAELKIGDSILMLGEAGETCLVTTATLYLYVPDVDTTYRAGLDAGGESMEEPATRFWGDRMATIRDFAGNKWMVATHLEDVDSDELMRRVQTPAA
jgi:PhnB protein